jgi:SAM-dependent methyltransferase
MARIRRSESEYYQYQPNLVEKISWAARKKMFKSLVQIAQPTPKTTVLDVGVTSERREASNFFEKLYPYTRNITAVATEDAYFLEQEFPGLKFIKADGLNLPFADKSFDLVVSFATIEHVGSRDRQRRFISELCRVGDAICISTPNRWYPIEFHILLPFIHWFPSPWFCSIGKWLGKDFYATEDNLNPLSERDVLRMLPPDANVCTRHFRLFGLISNLIFYVKT